MTSDIKPDTHLYTRTNTTPSTPTKMDGASSAPTHFGPAVAESVSMRSIFASLERVAPTDVAVLLQGDTGTGKELLARAVHDASARAQSAFVLFDCTGPNVADLEGELFGLEQSASGTVRKGAFENAEGGTLVFDEIGDLPLSLQAKILQALESKQCTRVGAATAMPSDVRVIATTRFDLKREVSRGRFLPELFTRLEAAAAVIPPLSARREDVRSLVLGFLKQSSDANPSAGPFTASEEALAALAGHDWPGNVRELRSVVERALENARVAGEKEIRLIGLPGASAMVADPYAFQQGKTYRETRARFEAEFERRYVKWLLGRHHGNISAAAREVQMDRKYLYDLAKKHGMRGKEDHGVGASS